MNYGEVVYVVPTTKQNTNTHTRSKTETDEALSESTQKKTRPTVSANPHPLKRRIGV